MQNNIVSLDSGFEICSSGNRETLVVLFHGYGSSGEDMIHLSVYMRQWLPSVHWYAPNGIEKHLEFGYQWFDYRGTDQSDIDRANSDLDNVYLNVKKLIEDKIAKLSMTWQNVVLIGFSQGSMMALHFALNLNEKIKGIISFSGACISQNNIVRKFFSPICMIHGQLDEVIKIEYLHSSSVFLKHLGFHVESHEIANLGHSIDMKGLKIASDFILKT